MTYTYNVFKTIEIDGVNYYFSKKAYNKMMKEIKLYNIDLDSDTCLMYCNDFEVI